MAEAPNHFLSHVEWHVIEREPGFTSDIPYSTHWGVLEIGGFKLRCYQLNTGQRVFDADDVVKFFGMEDSK